MSSSSARKFAEPVVLTLFVSDLHLSARGPETAGLFVDFLAGAARDAQALYILGDLFDYWLGDDDLADPFNERIRAALADLAAAGTATYFLPGNRDFLVGKAFAAATGVTLLPDIGVYAVAGRPTLLLHGDTLCTDDHAYMAFRATVRNEQWQREFLGLPLSERRTRIEVLRQRSESAKAGKTYELMDVNPDTVAATFRDHGVSRMIHGHTHRQACHDIDIDGRACQRWVLGDWRATGNALACERDNWRWLTIAP
jgi:UDP-2,3-diacylglucosamine hydrolase